MLTHPETPFAIRLFGLDHRFVWKDITTSLQDLKGFEYDDRWLKHTGYTHPIPYGIVEDGETMIKVDFSVVLKVTIINRIEGRQDYDYGLIRSGGK